MKVLFTCAYYVPEKAASIYLTEDIALGLAASGHQVDIVTPVPTRGVDDETRDHYNANRIESLSDGNLKVRRFGLYREGTGTVSRAVRYLMCNLKHLCHGLRDDYDVVFVDSTPPTQGLVSALVKLIRHKRVIYNAQDIFPDSLVSSGIAPDKGLAWKIGRWVERVTYWGADTIIVISSSMKDNLVRKGVDPGKIKVVYNWVDTDKVVPVNHSDNDLFEKYGINRGDFNVVYAGNLGRAQNIDLILDAARKLADIPQIKFIIFGAGNESQRIARRVEEERIGNVRLLPIQPAASVSKVYSLGDICIVSCKKNFGGIAMPSKFANILACGTPVIVSFDEGTDMQKLVEENRLGFFCPAENVDSFADSIKKAFMERDGLRGRHSSIRDFAVSKFSRQTGVVQYMDIITGRNE